jgi:hypothetical protein
MARLSRRRTILNIRSVNVRFIVGRLVLGQVSSCVLKFSLVCISPAELRTYLQLQVALTRWTKCRSPGNLPEKNVFSEVENY